MSGKINKPKSNKYFWSFLGIAIVLAGIDLLALKPKQKPSAVPINSPTPTKQNYQIDEVNDGIYTNYKYRFTFKYPTDVFDRQAVADPKPEFSRLWDYQSWGSSINGTLAGKKYTYLDIRVTKAKGEVGWPALHDVEESVQLKPGATFLEGRGTKLSNYERGDVKGSIFYFRVPAGVLHEFPEYLYSAELLKEENLCMLQLHSIDYQTLLNNKKIFDQIVDSFEYF